MNKTIIYEMNDEFEWNVVHEGQLLDAMVGHKPVGVNKYFQMAFICDKFVDHVHKDIDSRKIWSHLETMYNLEALDECESIPFPNTEIEFKLPESEYGNLIIKKDEELTKNINENATKQVKEAKKDEKTPNKNQKERRDSKEGKDNNKNPIAKKEIKKEPEKAKPIAKGRTSTSSNNESKSGKSKFEDTPKPSKRPTRGSLKSNDDSGSSGKSSPITVTPTTAKRIRRI
ncbi:MRG/MORF4L-binding protein isoform X1 [Diorhabda carinulata]|uniref:MRG/MORF4L-binding protein isoform X1 n=1 Tax=Diorhabda carinulata TaxID=1163345 RepID=UPI0025A07CBF|nr:MRG/MORF4L-binding protein isoform X1 [Diorhabda carinulata]